MYFSQPQFSVVVSTGTNCSCRCLLRLCAQVVAELGGKDLATLIKEGSEKLASVPSGGAAPAAGAAAAAPAGAADAGKKEEKKEEEEEEEDEDMGFGLFD